MSAEKEGEIPPSDSILFILVCFSIGVLIRLGFKWTRIPYTAMLLLVGLGIGFLQLANPATIAFTNTLRLWLSMEPHLLLLIFLPIIGFSASIAQEPHMLRKSWAQIMLLAWPGVVVQFLLIALCAKYVFPYGWTWPESFLFGAMMSATDPVAVVAVLQEVGASQQISCVIDGESLMNDGSALVIFLVLQKIVEGQAVTIGGAIAQFCLLAVVGMLLGIACGVCTSYLLEHIFRDPTLTTIVTLLSAYSSYYVADRLVGSSGLLAVVCNGFTMSLIGGRDITMRVEDSMHAFWGVLEWGANTILFVWMGIVLAIVLPPSHEETAITNLSVHLVPSDAGYVVILFLWLQVARAILLALCWIPFNYTGYPMTWRSALVFLWGGLRGAVGMVMALFIFLDEEIHNPEYRSYCIFYMGTMAFFTVLLNGGSVKWLLKTLGFMSYTTEQLTTLHHVVQDMDSIRDRRLQELGPDAVLGEPEPDVVKVWASLPTAEMLAEAAANTVRSPVNPDSPAVKAAEAAGLDPQLLYDYRCRMLHMVKAHYAEAYSHHLLSTQQVRTLQAAADKALDEVGDGLQDWALLEPNCRLRGLPKLLRAWKIHRVSGTLVQAGVYQQQLSNLTLMVGFIHAHNHAQEVLRQHIQAVGDAPIVKALSRTSRADSLTSTNSFNPMHNLLERFRSMHGGSKEAGRGGAEALFVLHESEAAAAAAQSLAERVTLSHPSLPAWLRSKQVAANILTEQHEFLQHLADAGLVQQRECMALEEVMHERFKLLLQSNTGLTAAFSYSRSRPPLNLIPLFDSLDEEQAEALMRGGGRAGRMSWGTQAPTARDAAGSRRCHWRVFYPEQAIAKAGAPIQEVVVVTKGAVRMVLSPGSGGDAHGHVKPHTVVASVGDPLGVCELMLGFNRTADLTADSMVQCLMVPTELFLQLVKTVPGVYTRAWQATAAQLAAQHHHILGEHRQLAPLNMFFRSCWVERVEPGQTFFVPRTALLLTGQVRSLLPLPAGFSLAVQNPKRTTSAADLLWPSNISSKWDGGPADSAASKEGGDAAGLSGGGDDAPPSVRVYSSSTDGGMGSSMARQQSAPSHLLPQLSPNRPQQQQNGVNTSGGSSSSSAAAAGGSPVAAAVRGQQGSEDAQQPLNIVVHDATTGSAAAAAPLTSPFSAAAAAGDGVGGVGSSSRKSSELVQLVAPAELPPGEFECVAAAMVLQVPRGPTLPGSLETQTYQAQVLGKGSIHHQGSGSLAGFSAIADRAATAGGGAGAGGRRDRESLSTRSWIPNTNMTSPFTMRDALQRISRSMGRDKVSDGDGCGSGGLQRQGSDALPRMAFLQKAAVSMRSERRHGGAGAGGAGSGPSASGRQGSTLHTVVEVRGGGGTGAAGAAATPATDADGGPGGGSSSRADGGAQQQQRRSHERVSFDLRATDVVLSNSTLRKRLMTGQQAGGSSESSPTGSPKAAAGFGGGGGGGGDAAGVGGVASDGDGGGEAAEAAAAAGSFGDNFVPRVSRLGSAPRLASIKRRSANIS